MLKKYIELQNRLAELKQGDDEGAAMVEYGLLVGLIAVVGIAAVKLLGLDVKKAFEDIAAALPGN